VTSGASNDLMQATHLAREMVLRYGMGNRTGYASISDDDLPKQSEETRQLVDAEVKELLDHSYARARSVLVNNEPALHRLATALLKNETLDAKEITVSLIYLYLSWSHLLSILTYGMGLVDNRR
jgi:ATP-dependent metalloprotease